MWIRDDISPHVYRDDCRPLAFDHQCFERYPITIETRGWLECLHTFNYPYRLVLSGLGTARISAFIFVVLLVLLLFIQMRLLPQIITRHAFLQKFWRRSDSWPKA